MIVFGHEVLSSDPQAHFPTETAFNTELDFISPVLMAFFNTFPGPFVSGPTPCQTS